MFAKFYFSLIGVLFGIGYIWDKTGHIIFLDFFIIWTVFLSGFALAMHLMLAFMLPIGIYRAYRFCRSHTRREIWITFWRGDNAENKISGADVSARGETV